MPSVRLSREGSRHDVHREQRDGRLVVVKCLKDPTDERAAASLRHEHQTLSSLDVAGVVRPLALEERNRRPTLVLEDAGDENLSVQLARGVLDTDTFLALACRWRQSSERVHRATYPASRSVPDNFVLATGRMTLVDFDSATTANGLSVARSVGSLLYMAPEATGRLRRGPDERSDLYSLGAIFYEMLTGRPPFPSVDPVELVHAHLARNPIAPAIINPAIPRPLSDITLRCSRRIPRLATRLPPACSPISSTRVRSGSRSGPSSLSSSVATSSRTNSRFRHGSMDVSKRSPYSPAPSSACPRARPSSLS